MSKIALAGNASGTGTITLESPNTNSNFTINLPAASGTLVTTGGTVTFGPGSAAAPSITSSTDTNTGIFFPSADNIAFSEGGVESFRLNNSGEGVFQGNVVIGGDTIIGGGLRANGTADNIYALVSGTAQAVSGTAVDFTGIPSWVKRITVMFNGVSTTGTSPYLIQIGAGSITNTGYQSAGSSLTNGAFVGTFTSTSGFICSTANTAAGTVQGAYRITLLSANTWVAEGAVFNTGGNNNNLMAGGVTLSGTLDRVRITTVTGADSFDNGTINIMYE